MKICDLVSEINRLGKYCCSLKQARDLLYELLDKYEKNEIEYSFSSTNTRQLIYVDDLPDDIMLYGQVHILTECFLIGWNRSDKTGKDSYFLELDKAIKDIEYNKNTILKKYRDIYNAE